MAIVSRLLVAPVKGLAVSSPDSVHLDDEGVPGDRGFVLVDPSDQRISSHRYPALITVQAAYEPDDERLELRFPNGGTVVDKVRQGVPVHTEVYRGEVSGYEVEGPFSEALSEAAGAPVRLVRLTTSGGGNDVDPVSMLSDATVEQLARDSDQVSIDPRRFRMTIGLSDCEPHEEDSWEGKTVTVGDAVLQVRGPIQRCAVTKLDPETGAREVDMLDALRRHRTTVGGGLFDLGMYATVEVPGVVNVGDRVIPA